MGNGDWNTGAMGESVYLNKGVVFKTSTAISMPSDVLTSQRPNICTVTPAETLDQYQMFYFSGASTT